MKDNKSESKEFIEITVHELKACLVFREEDEESGFIPVPAPPLHTKKEFSFLVPKKEVGDVDILPALVEDAEKSVLLILAEANREMFDISIPKITYFDCTINGERRVFDEWPKMKQTEDEKD